MIGGFPVLALEWGRGRKLASYVRDALADPTSFLVVSGERALSAEFPTEAQARTVLGALGAGARAHSRILGQTSLSATSVNEALHLLARKRVVRRLTPYSARAAPKTALWEVVDPYMRFWLRFVNRKVDLIERGRGSLLVEEFRQGWPSFRGRAIEPIVRDSLERLLPDTRALRRRPLRRPATGTGPERSRWIWWEATPGRWRSESPSSARSSGGSGGASAAPTRWSWPRGGRRCRARARRRCCSASARAGSRQGIPLDVQLSPSET